MHASWAHPRSRGENRRVLELRQSMAGSSPLTRGKRMSISRADMMMGLIPAHAGKTGRRAPSGRRRRAHPRSRGENPLTAAASAAADGSSPLTRGKLCEVEDADAPARLIPAHAGKTEDVARSRPRRWAHPRSRGENGLLDDEEVGAEGSSPLTRGKHQAPDLGCERAGLIPAHAGKTAADSAHRIPGQAHPRSRGENYAGVTAASAMAGSSPLTRGKHFLTCAFIAQIDQILESLELCAFSESYSSQDVYATDAPRDRVRSIDLGLRSSRGAS